MMSIWQQRGKICQIVSHKDGEHWSLRNTLSKTKSTYHHTYLISVVQLVQGITASYYMYAALWLLRRRLQ